MANQKPTPETFLFLYVKFASVNTFINENQDICVQMDMAEINLAMILEFGTEIYLQRSKAIVTRQLFYQILPC